MEARATVVHYRTTRVEPAPSILTRAARAYLRALQTNPVFTKSVTSALISVLADITAQKMIPSHPVNPKSSLNYALLGFFLTGPATHHFYRLLDVYLPPSLPLAKVLRLLVDRFLFGPAFLYVSLYLLNRLEGKSHESALHILNFGFKPMFKANLKFWIPLQYINVNYVPQAYRVLFANLCAFFWVQIMANRRRRAALRNARNREENE